MTTVLPVTLRGRYELTQVLGQGGFGRTYLAEDRDRLGSQCAIKHLLPSNPSQFKKAKELFDREAKILLELGDIPGNDRTPKCYAYFAENQEFYLVQEYIEGELLGDRLQPGQAIAQEEAVQILTEILEILNFIHSRNAIHRDVRPENLIRRASNNRLVLIDFGAVKEVVSGPLNTTLQPTSTQIYAIGYAPKEQRDGHPRINSDIYSLGITAIQALTGLEPQSFPREVGSDRVLWRDQAPNVDPELAAIVDMMVAEDADRRYQTASEVLRDLQRWEAQTQLVAPRNITNLGTLRNPWLVFAIVAPIIVVVVGLTSLTIFLSAIKSDSNSDPTSVEEATPAETPSETASPSADPDAPIIQDGSENSPPPQESSPEPETPSSTPSPDSNLPIFRDGS